MRIHFRRFEKCVTVDRCNLEVWFDVIKAYTLYLYNKFKITMSKCDFIERLFDFISINL